MTRYGTMYGPDYTFLGVPACDLDDASTWESAQVVVLGAPYDGGTSHRARARLGPRAIRAACYLGFEGSRPSLREGCPAGSCWTPSAASTSNCPSPGWT